MTEGATTPDPQKEPIYVMLKFNDRPAYVIGRVLEETKSEVLLHWPMMLGIYHGDQGMEVYSQKYMPFAKSDLVSIVKTSLHAISTPKNEFIAYYLKFKERWTGKLETQLEHDALGIKPKEKEVVIDEDVPEGAVFH